MLSNSWELKCVQHTGVTWYVTHCIDLCNVLIYVFFIFLVSGTIISLLFIRFFFCFLCSVLFALIFWIKNHRFRLFLIVSLRWLCQPSMWLSVLFLSSAHTFQIRARVIEVFLKYWRKPWTSLMISPAGPKKSIPSVLLVREQSIRQIQGLLYQESLHIFLFQHLIYW